jgi:hypothetical protein
MDDSRAHRILCIIVYAFALFAVACAQDAPFAADPISGTDTPLASIRGLCDDTPLATGCTASFGKEQFDALIRVVSPVGLISKARLAQTYAELFAHANAARDAGLEDSARPSDLT